MPIYAFTIVAGALGAILGKWAQQEWSLRISLRAAFYIVGAFVSWVILTTAAIDITRASTQNYQLVETLTLVMTLPALAVVLWMYFWFFRNEGDLTYLRSGILSFAMITLMFIALISMGLFLSL